jgi:hypothetical protein
MPVRSPKYAAISISLPKTTCSSSATEIDTATDASATSRQGDDIDIEKMAATAAATRTIEDQIQKAGLVFPIIVKPLTAAGTKASHAMAVLMDASAISRIVEKSPFLCQEYANHDSLLYKVYVFGDHVSVHKRRSLPNLPTDVKSKHAYVEFDS